MNMVLDRLPTSVLIDGAAVGINTDFRVCLRMIRAFDDERLTEHEKLTVLVSLLYPDIPENTALAIKQGLKFLNRGSELDEASARQLRVYSFEKDSAYIYSAFKSTFNIDLNTVEYLHWWTFRSLFADLGKDCFFNTLVSLRSRKNSGKLTNEEKEFVTRNSELIDLAERRKNSAVQDFISKIGRRN